MAKKKEQNTPEVVSKIQEKEPTYIMKVGSLSWGKNNLNHFINDDKPLICKSVMRQYATIINDWLAAGWIEEGSYK